MQIEYMWKTNTSAVENCPAIYKAPGGYVIQGKTLDAATKELGLKAVALSAAPSVKMHPLRDAADAIVIDLHAEASSEKGALAHLADGRASMAVGSHTHVPTADARLMPGGTAFQSDAGMCGVYDSVIGMNKHVATERAPMR